MSLEGKGTNKTFWTFIAFLIVLVGTFCFVLGCNVVAGDDDDDDDDDSDDDSSDDDDSGTNDDTIYDIQQGKIAEGTIVNLEDVVITTPPAEWHTGFFIQEPDGGEYSGIYVYAYEDVFEELDIQPGDLVDLSGEYTEYKYVPDGENPDDYQALSEILLSKAEDLVYVGQGTIPAAAVVASADVANGGSKTDQYEGVLIEVEDVEVTDDGLGYGEFEVSGGLIVDDLFFKEGSSPADMVSNGDHFDSIVGPLHYGFGSYKIEPRDLSDLGMGGGDDDDDDSTGDVTIYDIQQGNVTPDTVVTLSGVIATTPLTTGGQGFFVQEDAGGEYSGIYVFVFHPGSKALDINPGDVVELTGTYVEYGSSKDSTLSEITVENGSDVTVTGTDTVPSPEVVSAGDIATGGSLAENYEGVLVQVNGVTVTDPDMDYGEWEVTGGLVIDNLFYTYAATMSEAITSITGPLYYSFGDYKLEPRSASDIVN